MDRAIEIEPNSLILLVQKAEIYAAEGDLAAAGRLRERVSPDGRNPIVFLQRASVTGCFCANMKGRSGRLNM
jgi:hypothetical protein